MVSLKGDSKVSQFWGFFITGARFGSRFLPLGYGTSTLHNGFWRVWNLAKKFGKFLYKNLPIYKEKTWQKWSSVDPHCSLVTHSAKGRFKWKNWLFIMPFCQLLSILAAFLIANCNFWLERTWLTFLKRFMTKNWPKQKKKFPPGIELETFCGVVRCDNHYTTKTSYGGSWLISW